MKVIEHGLSIGIHRVESEFYLFLKPTGKLTHEDYKVITPMLENALDEVEKPTIKALVDCLDFEGWELRAAWDDFKLGLSHGRQFEKVAIVGGKTREKLAAKVGSWFIHGEMQCFETRQDALNWLEL